MIKQLLILSGFLISFPLFSQESEPMIRIAEIEINPAYIQSYHKILMEEANASLKLESGVLSIFPMYYASDSTKIRILEIYADKNAYLSHLKTPHFLKYKNETQNMVMSLNLVDVKAIDPKMMHLIFTKTAHKQ
ncbi:antibiotic biosynthesis monooxygenase family protein [Galbibacter sp. PAP.153]|uniref:putative quinol monooxygenase n=1 Tax=Galbibacter sp. PAP.153 TaxID=3104623 RepID=UPI00300A9928